MRSLLHGLCLTLALWFSPTVHALEVQGVVLQDQLALQNTLLHLNGAGVRYKSMFKVYVVGMYFAKKVQTPQEATELLGPKRISVTMLRPITANELGKLLTRAIEDNTPPAKLSVIIPQLVRLGQMFSEQSYGNQRSLQTGDNITIDWNPGAGTIISINQEQQGVPYREAEFFNAFLRVWLGDTPVDTRLKEQLLGRG